LFEGLTVAIVCEDLAVGEYSINAAPKTTRRKTPTAAIIHKVLFCSIIYNPLFTNSSFVYSEYRNIEKIV
jgi:hypothetical protein